MSRIYTDQEAAADFIAQRRWSGGAACPRCGTVGRLGQLHRSDGRCFTYKCYACRGFSTLRTGTVMEGSHMSYATWLAGTSLLVATGGAVSAGIMSKLLGISNQAATKLRRQICERLPPGERHHAPTGLSVDARMRVTQLAALDACSVSCRMAKDCRMSPNAWRALRLSVLIHDLSTPHREQLFLTVLDRLLLPQPLAVKPEHAPLQTSPAQVGGLIFAFGDTPRALPPPTVKQTDSGHEA